MKSIRYCNEEEKEEEEEEYFKELQIITIRISRSFFRFFFYLK